MSDDPNTLGVPVLSEEDQGLIPTPIATGESVGDATARIANLELGVESIITFLRALEFRYGERFVGEMLAGLKLFGLSFGTQQPVEGQAGEIFLDYSQPGDAVRTTVNTGAGFQEGTSAIEAALDPLRNRIASLEAEEADFAGLEAEVNALAASILLRAQTSSLAPIATSGDAGDLSSGILDPDRIPASVKAAPIVSSGGVESLTSPQQAAIGSGSVVVVTDGRTLYYSGAGSKTDEASYVEGADRSPAISQIVGLQAALNALLSNDAATVASVFDGFTDPQKEAIRDALGVGEEEDVVRQW